MPLSKRDTEFRLPRITYIDYKQLEMDRVLIAFLARLTHNGLSSRLNRKGLLRVDQFVDEAIEHPEWFQDFQLDRELVGRWIETHLMDVVNRGKPDQTIASPRPLHGFTYKFRNPRHSRDYGAAQQLYEMLHHARNGIGRAALEHLHNFFFEGHDKLTGKAGGGTELDVETQFLLRFLDQVKDAPENTVERESFPPLCTGNAELMAEDIQRLLYYRSRIPRSVMVDYLKVLLSFHLALNQLRMMKMLPDWVARQSADPLCAPGKCPMQPRDNNEPFGDCNYQVGLLIDMAQDADGAMARLSERSAQAHYRRASRFIEASFTIRKLDEFAKDLVRRGKISKSERGYFTVPELVAFLDKPYAESRRNFFEQRISGLIEDSHGDAIDLDPELQAAIDLQLDELGTYIEMLVSTRGKFHRRYLLQCLDSMLMKNRDGALIAQARTKGAPRRFVMDSRMLEVLLQIAVLRPGSQSGFVTSELRVDDLMGWLRERYGIFIDHLPQGDGFGDPSINDLRALRHNRQAFLSRLREIGFYRDLSDAYITQTVTPRYEIREEAL